MACPDGGPIPLPVASEGLGSDSLIDFVVSTEELGRDRHWDVILGLAGGWADERVAKVLEIR